MIAAATQMSARTTAACADCAWTSGDLTGDLTVRVASRQHVDSRGHAVAVRTHTVSVLEPSHHPHEEALS